MLWLLRLLLVAPTGLEARHRHRWTAFRDVVRRMCDAECTWTLALGGGALRVKVLCGQIEVIGDKNASRPTNQRTGTVYNEDQDGRPSQIATQHDFMQSGRPASSKLCKDKPFDILNPSMLCKVGPC